VTAVTYADATGAQLLLEGIAIAACSNFLTELLQTAIHLAAETRAVIEEEA
jgi:hypothetical protein